MKLPPVNRSCVELHKLSDNNGQNGQTFFLDAEDIVNIYGTRLVNQSYNPRIRSRNE